MVGKISPFFNVGGKFDVEVVASAIRFYRSNNGIPGIISLRCDHHKGRIIGISIGFDNQNWLVDVFWELFHSIPA